ncbi:transcriptional regulator [Mongoliitalea daihaiensis]|uniref:transcriptional regulator n=1 Tax=Mongoliitalea daihaiensis TaxID=2782006 RepID=UPI001F423F9A|nr:transcriptional regulator [Mongoliitalea daihaiensis]UJP65329.1 transcriptional regulator [Mongoliitalea daihaiensis]
MKKILLTWILIGMALISYAQVTFLNRHEVEVKFMENDFMVIMDGERVVGFRTLPEKGFNLKTKLQFFVANEELHSEPVHEVAVKDNYDLVGYDIDEGVFYALMQKGTTLSTDKYLIAIDLLSKEAKEVDLSKLLGMELQEFIVFDGSVALMGLIENRPAVQLFRLEDGSILTLEGIYFRDSKILQVRKEPELGLLDILVSKRNRFKEKQLTLLSFDNQGNKMRDVVMQDSESQENELVEGVLTEIQDYQQYMLGTFGLRRREAYRGLYIAEINQFGEYEMKKYTLEDFPNYYAYLSEKQELKKIRTIEKTIAKGKVPIIRPVFTLREIIPTPNGFLIYTENLTINNPRYTTRDGVYSPQVNANQRMFYDPNFMGGPWGVRNPGFRTMNAMTPTEYRYHAAYMIYIHRDGRVLWDNAINLFNHTRIVPGKYGEVHFDGEKLHFLHLDGVKILATYLKEGEMIFLNEEFEIQLIDENSRIRETKEESLELRYWYDDFFLLSGKQKVRFMDENMKEATKDVFFLTKIRVDGELFTGEQQSRMLRNVK